MDILVHDYGGYAFPLQLSRALAARGHAVTHLYAGSIDAPRGPVEQRAPGLEVAPILCEQALHKHQFVKRRQLEVAYGHQLADAIETRRPDVVLCGQTPSEPLAIAHRRARQLGVPFVPWVQDLYGLAVQQVLPFPVLREVAGAWYQALDARVLRAAPRTVIISDHFRPWLRRWRVPERRVVTIENWAPLGALPPRDNAWAREHDVLGRRCFLYCGMLGLKHDLRALVALAERLTLVDPEARVLVASQGKRARQLAKKAPETLRVIGFQPHARLAEMLASADVLLATLTPEGSAFSVPSKVSTYLGAGRPVVAAMPPENPAAQALRRSGAGVVVCPDDIAGFVDAAVAVSRDAGLQREMGQAGRRYAEGRFAIDPIARRFEAVFEACV